MNQLIKPIAHIENDFTSKFAIPRQSGILKEIKSRIVFDAEFRVDEAIRGIEEFSHLWLIWGFSQNPPGKWSPTVRPPKLGGNKRVGVFATRSPFRPNSLGLSAVKLEAVLKSAREGTYLVVSGADIMNGSPIYDIKPYLPFSDIYPDATGGFTDNLDIRELKVVIPEHISDAIDSTGLSILTSVLKEDPRPSYHNDPERVYGFSFGEYEVRFKVDGDVLSVVEIF